MVRQKKQENKNLVTFFLTVILLTASSVIAGYSVHEEMELWQKAGLPPAAILRSATIVPAEFVGLDNRLGTITERKTASLMLVRANPLEDIRNASQIESVFLRGRYFNRDALDRLLQQTRELCKR